MNNNVVIDNSIVDYSVTDNSVVDSSNIKVNVVNNISTGSNLSIFSTGNVTVVSDNANTNININSSSINGVNNATISNYTNEKIMLATPPTGYFFGDGNLAITSTWGTLFITNANDKIINFADGAGNDFSKAYAATYPGVIDLRGLAGYEVINGSDYGADAIFAGDGGSQLWGGNGVDSDTLVGGAGADVFIGGKMQGSDVMMNAASTDVVFLNDALLGDIVAAAGDGGTVAIAFNTGNVVMVSSSEPLSAAFILADGSAYRYNHVTQAWQTA